MAPPPPVLGDGDEPLGTGVLGDVGGSSRSISGDVTARAVTIGQFHHAFRGGGEDRHEHERERRRRKRRAWDRQVAAKKAREREDRRYAEQKRRERELAEWYAEQERLLENAIKRAELEDLALRLYAAQQERKIRDEEDIAVLLLAA